jgi:O-methyltransferase
MGNKLKRIGQVVKGVLQRKFILFNDLNYAQDGLYTRHNSGFMSDPEFIKAEQAGAATGSWSNVQWRVHTILWAAFNCNHLEGDFVECGTNKGGFARAIAQYLHFEKSEKTFYLLDTFKGLVPALMTDEEKKLARTDYKDCYEQVVDTFKTFKNIKVIRGIVPDTLPFITSDKIAFISIDMNSIKPEIDAMNYLWPKLVKGGMVVLDDYAFHGYEPQFKAHNEWAKAKGVSILSLPTGQGLIVK